MEKPPDNFNAELSNFDFGIVCHCSPEHLNRREDFYIYNTEPGTKAALRSRNNNMI